MSKKVNKVIYGNQTIMDVTDATGNAGDILLGKTAYIKDGSKATLFSICFCSFSAFIVSNESNSHVLNWYGTQTDCPYEVVLENGVYYLETIGEHPYSISIEKNEYVLNFTFTTT